MMIVADSYQNDFCASFQKYRRIPLRRFTNQQLMQGCRLRLHDQKLDRLITLQFLFDGSKGCYTCKAFDSMASG
jgi:hypothetical protein